MSTVLQTSARLELSRERLRQSMMETSTQQDGSARLGNGRSTVLRLLSWWEHHPLHLAGAVAAETADAMVKSTAQRHPLGLVLGAFVFGGLLVLSRPWRWLFKPALLVAVLPQLVKKIVTRVPPQAWIAMWAALTSNPRHQPNQTMPYTTARSGEVPLPGPRT